MQSKMSDTETKTIFISNNKLLQYKANKAKQKNRQCVSSILALNSYVFFFRLTLKSYTNYIAFCFFLLFVCLVFKFWFRFVLYDFAFALFFVFVCWLFFLSLFVLLFYYMYLIVFCLCVCVYVCVASWITWDHFSWIFDPIINKEILQYINCFGNVDMWC